MELVDKVREALRSVPEPHIPTSVVEFGLVSSIEVNGNSINVRVSLPCLGCPAQRLLKSEMVSAVELIPEVREVNVEFEWTEVWDRSMIDAVTAASLREWGVAL